MKHYNKPVRLAENFNGRIVKRLSPVTLALTPTSAHSKHQPWLLLPHIRKARSSIPWLDEVQRRTCPTIVHDPNSCTQHV